MPGRVKTRLVPALGEEGAAALAARMLSDTAREALAANIGPVELCADPDPDDPAWDGHRPPGVVMTAQGPGDLGTRLAGAADRAILTGEPALLIGTDCPSLDAARLRAAAAALADRAAVIHPAEDGGYVLLGLARFHPSLFEGIGWGGAQVGAATIARIEALGWPWRRLETLRDVDEPADLL